MDLTFHSLGFSKLKSYLFKFFIFNIKTERSFLKIIFFFFLNFVGLRCSVKCSLKGLTSCLPTSLYLSQVSHNHPIIFVYKFIEKTNKILLLILCLTGDRESGKTTLVAKLQGNVDPKKGSGLEYAQIDVRDEYRDGEWKHILTPQKPQFFLCLLLLFFILDHTHLAMWVLDGDRSHSHLLSYALTDQGYSNTTVMLNFFYILNY